MSTSIARDVGTPLSFDRWRRRSGLRFSAAAILLAIATAFLLSGGQDVFGQAGGPDVAELMKKGNRAFSSEEDFAAAEKHYRAAGGHPDATEAQKARAGFYLCAALGRQEKYEEAVEAQTEWLERYPEDPSRYYVRLFLGIHQKRLGREAEARKAWGPILRDRPDSDLADSVRRHLGIAAPAAPAAPATETETDAAPRALPPAAKPGPYLVVLTALEDGNPEHEIFREVGREVAAFHDGEVLKFGIPPLDLRDFAILEVELREKKPENVLFVVPPEVLDVPLHRRLLLLSSGLDGDVFPDFAFGYFTAKDGADLKALWARTKKLHEKGLTSRVWQGTSVTSGSSAFESPGKVPVHAKAAGFTGSHIYYAFPEKDPKAWDFIDAGLKKLSGAGVITMTGNGDPEGIWIFPGERNRDRSKHWPYAPDKVGEDPKGEMPRITADRFRALGLNSPVVWSGTCHSGATRRVFVEGDIVSTFGRTERATVHRLPPEKSLCLAILEAGAGAFLCPLGANHGYSVSLETEFAVVFGASLGETIKSTYDDVHLAARGAPRLDLPEEGGPHLRNEPVMQGGGSNRILIGDPALRLFTATPHPTEEVRVERTEDGLTVVAEWKEGHHWRGWDIYGTDLARAARVWTRVPLPDGTPDGATFSATVEAVGKDGKPLPFAVTRVEPESFHGRRYLHLQANASRAAADRKHVRATFRVRIAEERAD